jgi:hypothetical protein
MKHKRIFFAILLVAACLVWVHNFTLFFNATPNGKIAKNKSIQPYGLEKFVYKADFPDPFFCKQVMVEKKAFTGPGSGQKKKEEIKLPFCKIGGIVYNESNPMAIFICSGKSKLVKQGDVIDSMTIRKIFKDSVEILFKSKKFFLAK